MENKDIKFGTGVILSPPDKRDYLAGGYFHPDVNDNIPKSFTQSNIPKKWILNQGWNSSCIACMVRQMCELLAFKKHGKDIKLSHAFVWNNRKKGQDIYTFPAQSGMVSREALNNARDYGVCEESLFPWKHQFGFETNPDETLNMWDEKQITQDMTTNALKYKIGSFMSATTDFEVKLALMKDCAVGFIIPIFDGFTTWNPLIDQRFLNNTDQSKRGTHGVACVGWVEKDNVEYWECVNSWGDFHYKGIFYIPIGSIIYEKWIAHPENTPKHWAEDIYNYLLAKNVYSDAKDFNTKSTRGYVFEMLAKTLGYRDTDQYTRESYDVYYDYCKLNGVEALEKRYDSMITRGEVMALISKLNGWKDDGKPTPKGEHWAEKFFAYLNNNGIKIFDRRFNDNITKGEFLVFCAKKLGYKG